MRWLHPGFDPDKLGSLTLPTGVAGAEYADGAPVVLFPSDWTLRYFQERNEAVTLHATPAKRLSENKG